MRSILLCGLLASLFMTSTSFGGVGSSSEAQEETSHTSKPLKSPSLKKSPPPTAMDLLKKASFRFNFPEENLEEGLNMALVFHTENDTLQLKDPHMLFLAFSNLATENRDTHEIIKIKGEQTLQSKISALSTEEIRALHTFVRGHVTFEAILSCALAPLTQQSGAIERLSYTTPEKLRQDLSLVPFGSTVRIENLSNETLTPALDIVTKSPRIYGLFLGSNLLGDEGIEKVSTALSTNPYIQKLNLGLTGMTLKGLNPILDLIAFNKNIHTLFMAANNLGNTLPQLLCQNMAFLSALRTLNIGDNDLTDDAIPDLVTLIQKSHLTTLNLHNSKFSPEGTEKLLQAATQREAEGAGKIELIVPTFNDAPLDEGTPPTETP